MINSKRAFDLVFACLLMIIFVVPFILISLLIKATSEGPVLHWSKRIGKNNRIFPMPKFRTMKVDTPQVATHLLRDSKDHITSVGNLLRRSSLDEIPQLWCIFKGEMSFVGPRPALFNQDDLVLLRTELGIEKLSPGVTGWAQINGRDSISIKEKVKLDYEYSLKRTLFFDLKIIFLTVIRVLGAENISH